MNVYDAERMADLLAASGYAIQESPDHAEIVIFNTCHIREKAAEKVYTEIGRLRKSHRDLPRIFGVVGCLAQAEADEVHRRAPSVSFVVGPQDYHKLPSAIGTARAKGKVLSLDLDARAKFAHLDALPVGPNAPTDGQTFVTIQEGCDKFCTFCVVPYTRGAEFSRDVDTVLSEARARYRRCATTLVLLGQNVNAYRGRAPDGSTVTLAGLIQKIADEMDVDRLSYLTSHPRDMQPDLIQAHARVKPLLPYLHLPLQSGSDSILGAMNRGHTLDDYLRLIDRIRNARGDIALSSDFIVGFPGETEADHRRSLEAIERVGFSRIFAFCYSARPGTPAANLAESAGTCAQVARRRLHELQAVARAQQHRFNGQFVKQTVEVAVSRKGREGIWAGRSRHMVNVQVRSREDLQGKVVRVRIMAAVGGGLTGDVVPNAA